MSSNSQFSVCLYVLVEIQIEQSLINTYKTKKPQYILIAKVFLIMKTFPIENEFNSLENLFFSEKKVRRILTLRLIFFSCNT